MSKDEYIQVSARIRHCRDSDTKVVFGDERNSQICFRINKNEKLFPFDNVFSENTSQESVFINVGKRIIDGCLAGYNGTIFAYGQTGSGKTYTMFGPVENEAIKKSTQGLIPRCMNYLFEKLNSMKEEESDLLYNVNCSFIQLYNENLYDLLDKVDQRIKIRTDANGEVFAEGASMETVMSSDDVAELLRIGLKNRRITETKMNRESSRSHAIFIANISTKHVSNGVINNRSARLNLVDLAGSERQCDSQAAGNALKEATFINKSLLTLTRVIRSLSKNSSRYPGYRDSKLTHLLQDSLGGNTRSSMIINLHPNLSHSDTTASTLYFSDSVKRIRNKATVNENIAGENIEVLKREISRLHEENEQLKGSNEEYRRELAASNAEKEDAISRLVELEQEKEVADVVVLDQGDGNNNWGRRNAMNTSVLINEIELAKSVKTDEAFSDDAEKKILSLSKLLTKAEKGLELNKAILKKREEAIVQFESDLAYKARRLDHFRKVLDSMHEKQVELEEEIEQLRKKDEFHQLMFEKEKQEIERKIREENEECNIRLTKKLEEIQKERDECREELALLVGHRNPKQKIQYVNRLRERISVLENENADYKARLDLEEEHQRQSTIIAPTARLRQRPVSQPPVPKAVRRSASAAASNRNPLPPKKK